MWYRYAHFILAINSVYIKKKKDWYQYKENTSIDWKKLKNNHIFNDRKSQQIPINKLNF